MPKYWAFKGSKRAENDSELGINSRFQTRGCAVWRAVARTVEKYALWHPKRTFNQWIWNKTHEDTHIWNRGLKVLCHRPPKPVSDAQTQKRRKTLIASAHHSELTLSIFLQIYSFKVHYASKMFNLFNNLSYRAPKSTAARLEALTLCSFRQFQAFLDFESLPNKSHWSQHLGTISWPKSTNPDFLKNSKNEHTFCTLFCLNDAKTLGDEAFWVSFQNAQFLNCIGNFGNSLEILLTVFGNSLEIDSADFFEIIWKHFFGNILLFP